MSHSQHYNDRFEPKSWEVVQQGKKLVLKQSFFAPGYSGAHHETQKAAILHAMTNFIEEIEQKRAFIDDLNTMIEDLDKDEQEKTNA